MRGTYYEISTKAYLILSIMMVGSALIFEGLLCAAVVTAIIALNMLVDILESWLDGR